MNDILPPKRPLQSIDSTRQRPLNPVSSRPLNSNTGPDITNQPQPLLEEPLQPLLIEDSKPRRSRKKRIIWSLAVMSGVLLLAVATAVVWYEMALSPVSSQSNKTNVQIVNGSSSTQVGTLLQEKKMIRSAFAFDIYTRLTNTRMKLQAGTFSLSPSQSVSQIVSQIAAGKVDQFSITFLPGATLAENRAGLIKAGYSAASVDAALNKTYDSPLFTDKPASADLEGYIYGDTYQFNADATVEQILTRTFDEYYTKITENNLISGFKAQGLNLYQGITLASIIQREVSREVDQKQVAQVFYTRLATNMPLGSDVTYQYAAKKLGVAPSPTLDSPYNTRINTGLPPGPIATPGLSALEAVAAPAAGDYVYFLSGDDGVTYFAVTAQEHDANIVNHCQIKCATP